MLDKKQVIERGIVLVDEIDLHLHPKWQRVIIKTAYYFPNVQFLFTTHSPTIIQGASEDAIIYRVYQTPKMVKQEWAILILGKDLDHLMINTILTSPLFGLLDSRMNTENDDADTKETYLLYRINKNWKRRAGETKSRGKNLSKTRDIDKLIDAIIKKELGKND